MKNLSNKVLLPLFSLSTLLMFNACSSHEIVASSYAHPYDQNFGMVQDFHADAALEKEYLAMNEVNEIQMPIITDPELTTELHKDPDAFLAEEYVQTPPVITYKYQFDPKFYSDAEWRSMDLQ